jgi:hypothetical protein
MGIYTSLNKMFHTCVNKQFPEARDINYIVYKVKDLHFLMLKGTAKANGRGTWHCHKAKE